MVTELLWITEFPVLLKASAGGGGKGMRTIYDAAK
jgi:biotin carboxylase